MSDIYADGRFAAPPALPSVLRPAQDAGAAFLPASLIILTVCIFLVPEDMSLPLTSVRLTGTRITLLALSPLVMLRLFQQFTDANFVKSWSDVFVPIMALWFIISGAVTGGSQGVVGGGATALEFCIPYFAVRSLLTKPGQAMLFARLVATLIAITGFLALLDTLSSRFVLHELAAGLTGYAKIWRSDERYGFMRAMSTFEHPIMLGTACVMGFLMATALPRAVRLFVFAGCGIGLLTTISSAPFGGALAAMGLALYRRVFIAYPPRWRLLEVGIGSFLLLLFLFHPSPFGFLISKLALDPSSGYFRLLTWQMVGPIVLDSPVFGNGQFEWSRPSWMPGTIDSVWLNLGLLFGLPGPILLLCSALGACSRRIENRISAMSDAEKRLGICMSYGIVIYIYLGMTVHFWGIAWSLFGFVLALRAHLGGRSALLEQPRQG